MKIAKLVLSAVSVAVSLALLALSIIAVIKDSGFDEY